MTRRDWRGYLARYHRQHPAITEEILTRAFDSAGRDPYEWLLDSVPTRARVSAGARAPIGAGAPAGPQQYLDVACGSAPLSRELRARGHYLGVDLSEAELREARARNPGVAVAIGSACNLPLADSSVDTVVCSMALMLFDPLREALSEFARVLRPGGKMVAVVPVDGVPSPKQLRLLVPTFWRLRSLPEWPQRITARGLRSSVAALPLRLAAFQRKRFDWVIDDPASARKVVEGLYLPGVPAARMEAAVRYVMGRVDGSPSVPVHLARIVLARDA